MDNVRYLHHPITMRITAAFREFKRGRIDGFGLYEVIKSEGFSGFTVTEDLILIVHV